MSGINQLIPPDEIKHEPDIKEEPIADGDLVEFPAFFNGMIGQPLGDPVRYNGGDGGIGNLPFHDFENKGEPGVQRLLESKAGNANKPRQSHAQDKAVKQYPCDKYEYTTKYTSHFNKHLLKHTGEKPFPCNHCSKEFVQKYHLQYHMKVHVGMFHFNCVICLEGFDEKDNKLEHERECQLRRYECHLCKQPFGMKKDNLMNHIRIHSGSKPFQCKECSKQFTTDSNHKKHIKTHAGPPSFYCSRCRLGFVQRAEMVAHEQKCSRRLYECYVCHKFIGLNKRTLERHMRTHTGAKPFQCTMCPSKFTRNGNLKKHINRIHNKNH